MYTVSKYSSVGNLLDLDKLTNLTSFLQPVINNIAHITNSIFFFISPPNSYYDSK